MGFLEDRRHRPERICYSTPNSARLNGFQWQKPKPNLFANPVVQFTRNGPANARAAESGIHWPRSQLPRHPSQLYQFALEGVLLFLIVFLYTRKQRPRLAPGALFVLCYGIFRFVVEFFREPDGHIGFDALGWVTRGQLLSLPMIAVGLGVLIYAYRRDRVQG